MKNRANVYIVWSGDTAKEIAGKFKDWLEKVNQSIEAFFSPDSITIGKVWQEEINKNLDKTDFGILIMTKESVKKRDWVLFEAGALAKKFKKSNVCPILFGIDIDNLPEPISQFQAKYFGRDDMYALHEAINESSEYSDLKENKLREAFGGWWDAFEKDIKEIIENDDTELPDKPELSNEEKIHKILEITDSIYTQVINMPNKLYDKLDELEILKEKMKGILSDFRIISNYIDNQKGIPSGIRQAKNRIMRDIDYNKLRKYQYLDPFMSMSKKLHKMYLENEIRYNEEKKAEMESMSMSIEDHISKNQSKN